MATAMATALAPLCGLYALVNIGCSLATVALVTCTVCLHLFLFFSDKLIYRYTNNISDNVTVNVSIAYFDNL